MKTIRFYFILLAIAFLMYFVFMWYRLTTNVDVSFRALGIQAVNEDVVVGLVGTYHESQANHLRLEARNLADIPMMIAFDIRRESTLWYGGGTQVQFCLLLDRGEHQTIDIPFPLDHWKFYKDSETSISILVSIAEKNEMILGILTAYEQHIPKWNFCFRELGMTPGARIYHSRFPTDSLFDYFWDPEKNFNLYQSPSFDVYAHKLSIVNQYIEDIILRRENAFDQIRAILGVEYEGRLRLVFYPDDETKRQETNHVGKGYAWQNNVVEIYNENMMLDDYHEIAHVVVGLIGSPPAMLNEGFAVYISEKLGAAALEGFGYGTQTIDQVAKDLYDKGELLPIEDIFGFREIGSEASRWAVSYPQAASFSKFLIQSHGYDVFRKLLAELRNSGVPEVIEQNKARFHEITGMSIQEQAGRWIESLNN